MISFSILLTLFALFTLLSAHPLPSTLAENKTPLFLLAGDSTTAPQAPGGGGWGAGFLSLLVPPASGTNYGQNGATTVSFKQKGNWGKIISETKQKRDEKSVYVTIQFGHNDQKEGKGISLDMYKGNLVKMAGEVKDAGGTAILVTPLTRRSFSGSKVTDNLKDQRIATIAAGKASNTVVLDLNAESQRYVNSLGKDKAHRYNAKEGDTSHLNVEGSKVFGRMVADLMLDKEPNLGRWIKKDERMSENIKAGRPAR